nr:PREDICTED: golgin subfamily A member 4-like isoform X3 [Bemisia tabaci]
MFKKLKDKITEEVKQSPLKFQASVQQLAQAVAPSVTSSTSEATLNDHFVISEDDSGISQTEQSKDKTEFRDDDGMSTLSFSRRSSLSSATNDLFPVYESPSAFNQFQSDLESNASEVEDFFTSYQLDHISKEKLYHTCRKIQSRYQKYKGRYSDLVRHYKKLEQENQKAKSILSETQDKALRRIADLKEQCQLEQKAKAHLEESLRNDIEERDHIINTLNTKIGYLRDSSESGIETESLSKTNGSSENLSTSPVATFPPVSSSGDAALKEKIKNLEELLQKSKGVIIEKINTIKDLNKENTELKSDVKELATVKDKVVSLQKLVETLQKSEEEAAISAAETKQSIYLELESKEAQVKNLKETLAKALQEKARLSDKVANLEASMQSSEDIAVKLAKAEKELERKWSAKLNASESHFMRLMDEKDRLMKKLQEENELLQSRKVEFKPEKPEDLSKEKSCKDLSLNTTEIANLMDGTLNINSGNDVKKPEGGDKLLVPLEDEFLLSPPPEDKKSVCELKNIIELLKGELNEKETKLRHINEHSLSNSAKLNLSIEKVNQMESDFRSKREEWMQMKTQFEKQIEGYLSEIANLNCSLEDLRVQIKDKEGEVTNYSATISDYRQSLTNLKEELGLKTQENGSLRSEISELKNELTKYKSNHLKADQLEKDFVSLTSKFEEETSKCAQIVCDLNAKSEELENIRDKNSSLKQEIDQLSKTVEERDTSLTELQSSLSKAEKNFENEMTSLKGSNNELLSNLKKLEGLLSSKDDEIAGHRNLVTNLEKSIASLKQQLQNSHDESQVELLRAEIKDLKNKNESAAAELQKYDLTLNELHVKLQDYETKLQEAENAKKELENCLKDKSKEYLEYKNEHNEFLKIKNILETNHLQNQKPISELISNLVESNQSASHNEEALNNLRLELEVCKKSKEKWQLTAEETKKGLAILKDDVLSLRAEFAKTFNKTKENCFNLLTDCQNYTLKFVEKKKRSFDIIAREFEHRESELKSIQFELCEKIKDIKHSVNSKNSEIEAQQKRISELIARVQISETITNDYSERIKVLQAELVSKNKIIDALKSDQSNQELSNIGEEHSAEWSQKELEIEKLKSEVAELKEQLNFKNSEVKDFHVGSMSVESEAIRSECKQLNNASTRHLLEKSREVEDATSDLSLVEIENLELRHQQEIHEIEKRYASLLAEKYKEYEILEAKYHEQELEQERRLNKEVREIIKDAKESEELQNEQLDEFRLQLQQTEKEATSKIEELKQAHLVEMNATIKKWKNFLDKKIAELEQKHCDEVMALTREWHQERKELEKLANSAGADSETVESLHIQLKALKKELNDERSLRKHEVQELQQLLSKKNSLRQPKECMEQDLEDCTEMEYLRNILYEYMMGKEPVVLARVLAALVKFDSEQTSRVLQKEEQRYTLLGQLGMS